MGEWDAEEQLDEIQEYYLVQPGRHSPLNNFLIGSHLRGKKVSGSAVSSRDTR